MPICPSCGAASADPAVTCANCGRPLAAPAIGDVIEDSAAVPGGSPWGAGKVHHTRETPLLSRGWLIAGRVLLAPTALLLLAAAIGSGSHDESPQAYVPADSGNSFQGWLTFILTAFGTPLRMTMSPTEHRGDGSSIGMETSLHLVLYLVALGWLLLLWFGLHLGARGRRRAGAAEPAGAAVAVQALRTGAVSAAVALLLGWLAGQTSDGGDGHAVMSSEVGPALLPLAVSAGLAAAVLVLAVDGAAALRAEAARRGWLGSLLAAWQHAFRVVVGLLVLLTVVGLVTELADEDGLVNTGNLALATNLGVMMHGIGSGATLLSAGFEDHRLSLSLFDLGDHTGAWWFAALLPLVAALALGWSAHRGRLPQRDRAVLAGLYALLNTLLLLGTSMWLTMGGSYSSADRDVSTSQDAMGWSVLSVLVSALVWGVFGALAVPGLLDGLRGTPVPLAPPLPAAPPFPAAPPMPGALPGTPVLSGQAAGERPDTVAHGSVELVVDEPPAPAVALDKDADPHAGFRRPEAD
ncbi:hypothetical protein [Kitasatospora sp. NPDC057198]|uniref:hypothetical protein n=1 Tax=Kitasatospora sp. NPDC057198 TaxID=3346046 RepID=UPI00363245B3